MERLECQVCHKKGGVQVCTGCEEALYCSRECQIQDWAAHKPLCKQRQAQRTATKPAGSSSLSASSPSPSTTSSTSMATMKRYAGEARHRLESAVTAVQDLHLADRARKKLQQLGGNGGGAGEYSTVSPPSSSPPLQTEGTPADFATGTAAVVTTTTAVFGVDIECAVERWSDPKRRLSRNVPEVVVLCCSYIERKALEEEGVFRLSGSVKDVGIMKAAFQQGLPNCQELIEAASDPHLVSSLLKMWLRELPEPLLGPQQELGSCSEEERVRKARRLLKSVSETQQRTAWVVFRLLQKVASLSDRNKMSVTNLAIVFSATLTSSTDLVSVLISHFDDVFSNKPSPAGPPVAVPDLPRGYPHLSPVSPSHSPSHSGSTPPPRGAAKPVSVDDFFR